MPEYKGKNSTIAKGVNGASKINSGEHVGRVRCLYEEIDLTAQALAAADTILVGAPLQGGARVLEAVIAGPALGGTSTFNLGWQANLQDVLDDDGFIAGAAVGAGPTKVVMAAGAPGLGKKFESETQVIVTNSGAVAAGGGKIVKIWLYYVLD